jgi:starch synthase
MNPSGSFSTFGPGTRLRKVLIAAAEFRGLAKVGGLADVTADLSATLRRKGLETIVVLPGYPGIEVESPPLAVLTIPFAGRILQARVSRTKAGPVVIGNDELFGGHYDSIYVDSSLRGKGPFEDDAQRFAFFCRAITVACECLPLFDGLDVLHCHDWHTGLLVALARLSGISPQLSRTGILFTIHNLDYQGIRPVHGTSHDSLPSFLSWFPDLGPAMLAHPAAGMLLDPRYPHCVNPMRAAIRLSDRVNTVSPTYAREITTPDAPERSFTGGRGLETDLRTLDSAGYLSGILNGVDYDDLDPMRLEPPFGTALQDWPDRRLRHKELLWHELSRLEPAIPLPPLARFLDTPLAVSVGRLARQKVSLFLEKPAATPDALPPEADNLISALARRNLNFVMLGAGELLDPVSRAFAALSSRPGFALIPRFDAALASRLYRCADLFLMPSDFEPCGLSQLISMRFGTLPVASSVGGLADTIRPSETGFLFPSGPRNDMAAAFLAAVDEALSTITARPDRWRQMQEKAMQARFSWDGAADRYIDLYLRIVAAKG